MKNRCPTSAIFQPDVVARTFLLGPEFLMLCRLRKLYVGIGQRRGIKETEDDSLISHYV
jgi:hypothetical protein